MQILANMKVKSKLAALVAVFLLGFGVFGAVAYNTLTLLQINGPKYQEIILGKDLIADVLPPPEYIIETFLVALEMADPAYRPYLQNPLPGQKESLLRKSERLEREYRQRHTFWVQKMDGLSDAKLKELMLVTSYNPAIRFFKTKNTTFKQAILSGDYARGKELLLTVLAPAYREHREAIDAVVLRANSRNARIEGAAYKLVGERTRTMVWVGLAIILIAGLGMGTLLSRSIARTLQETVTILSSTSSELASTIEEQERTAMHQSAAVHQTTTTMDELDASFTQTADMVKTAADTARQSMAVADDGIHTVQQTLDGMVSLREKVTTIAEQILSLSEQTSQIGTITHVVGDLANQTNMLALNAAVEAARAGEHGKGFGVVAAEIRKLADESKKSAERINALVDGIQKATNSTVMATEEGTKTVEAGIKLAQETVESFNGVVESSNTASDAAQQTLLSVPQQVTAVKQVLESMESLNRGARETAAGLSQTKTSVENLRETRHKIEPDDLKRKAQ